jgi:glycosyltransferase involved in cell wall biosynthesis
MMKLLITVPCYNEETILRDSAEKLLGILNTMKRDLPVSADSGILFVDDGSTDGTWRIIRDLHEQHPEEISALRLAANRGHQSALFAGLMEARKCADITISIDADLQDDIQVLPEMVRKAEAGADIVFGVRSDRSSDSWCKRFFAELFYRIMRLMGVNTINDHADFRLMSAKALDALSEYREVNLFLRGMVVLLGFETATVYYKRLPSPRSTHYSIPKMLHLAWDGITSFSVYPIVMISMTGVLFMLIGIVILGYILFSKFFGYTVQGWTFLASLIVIFGGFQTFAIGIIGEYIAKTYLESKHRPLYYIRERL